MIVTLVFPFNTQGQILLSMKKRGFGVGKWNGSGGKIKEGESIPQAALRELEEEIGVKLQETDLEYKGVLQFLFLKEIQGERKEELSCHIFFANYDGEIQESEEMAPKWFNIADIPYEQMREDDKIWLPELLQGTKEIEYTFTFDSSNNNKMIGREKLK